MKFEWKKHEKALYGAKSIPALVEVPAQNFIMIQGSGNPNDTDFSDRVAALYSLAYAVKMGYRSDAAQHAMADGILDFTVYPLEGVWKLKDAGEKSAAGGLVKENLEYTIMIRQPDFVTAELVYAALGKVAVKKPNPLYGDIHFDTIHDGKCVEILHTGPYDTEPFSFEQMDTFAAENSLRRISDCHREIYLSNANRTKADALKTILRYRVNEDVLRGPEHRKK